MRDTILWKKESDQYFKRSLFSLSDDLVDAEKEVKKLSKIVPNKKEIKSILDLGCNCGVFTGFLTKYFPRADITGIDPSEKAIKFARAKYKKISNLKFIVGGVPGLFFKKKFDLVVVRMVLQWLPRQNLFETMAEIDKLADRLIYINEFSPLVASTSTSIHNKKVKIFKQDYYKIFTSVPYWIVIYQKIFDAKLGERGRRGVFLLKRKPLEKAYKKLK